MVPPPPLSDDPLGGQSKPVRIGPYELLELLGEGAMAQVYRARHYGAMGFNKEVALKILRKGMHRNRNELEALINEARLGGKLKHPNLVETYGCEVVEGRFFLAMEYVRGWVLDEVQWRFVDAGLSFPKPAIVDTLRQVARGLAYAHEAMDEHGAPLRLIHRDLKPHNIFLSELGTVKIADFGLAKSTSNLYQTTDSDSAKGSPLYMSPEQVSGDRIDSRSDLFALGAVAVELTTGLRAFDGNSIPHTLKRVLEVEWNEARGALSRVFPELLPIVDGLLQLDPTRRYLNARELLKDLDVLASGVALGAHTAALSGVLAAQPRAGAAAELEAQYSDLATRLAAAEGAAVPTRPPPAEESSAPGWEAPQAPVVGLAPEMTVPPDSSRAGKRIPSPPSRVELFLGPAMVVLVLLLVVGLAVFALRSSGGETDPKTTTSSTGDPTASPSQVTPSDTVPLAATTASSTHQQTGAFIHFPRASVRLWDELVVVVQAVENRDWSLRCHYRVGEGTDNPWKMLPLVHQGNGRYELEVPVTTRSGGGLLYYIEATSRDRASPVSLGSRETPFQVRVL